MAERFTKSHTEFPFEETIGEEVSLKGIDGARGLRDADSKDLLQHHLRLERSDTKAFWKDGFILFKIWVTGGYCTMLPEDSSRGGVSYPHTRDGFHQFLHDHGSQISPDEISRRMKVFRTYNKYPVTAIRLVERAGVNKAFAAIPHINDDNVQEVLELCIETPYYRLRAVLQARFPRVERVRQRREPTTALQANQQRFAAKIIGESDSGMIGDRPIFIPRQYRQDAEDEFKAQEIFDFAMKRLGINDRDAFFMRVVDLVGSTWLTAADLRAVEARLDAYRAGEQAREQARMNPAQ